MGLMPVQIKLSPLGMPKFAGRTNSKGASFNAYAVTTWPA